MFNERKIDNLNVIMTILICYCLTYIFSIRFEMRNVFIIFTVIAICALIFRKSINGDKYKITNIDMLVFAYLAIVIVYFFMQSNSDLRIKGLLAHIKYIIFYFIGRLSFVELSNKNINKIRKFLIIIGVITVLYGIYQYYFDYYTLGNLLGNENLFISYGGNEQYRPKQMYSFFLSPLTTAYVLSIPIIISFVNLVSTKFRVKNFLIFVFLLYGIILTYNRTMLISVIISIVLFMIIMRKKVFKRNFSLKIYLLLWGLLVGVSVIFFTKLKYILTVLQFNNTWQTAGHYYYLQKGIEFIHDYPFGLGLGVSSISDGTIEVQGINTWNESFYFFISTEIGIIGLVIYLGIMISIFKKIVSYYKRSESIVVSNFLVEVAIEFLCLSFGSITLPIFMAWIPTNIIFVMLGMIISHLSVQKNFKVNFDKVGVK